ncbi:MAG: CmcJ/NvfI family oxidoreductase [Novosphingobium sp.]|nr:CmcJ/NvfI family oxidoreductase [Novosphingobium sp.]
MSGAVTAELGYLDDPSKLDDGRELHYFADFAGSTNARLKPHPARIEDKRGREGELTLDRNGFSLARWPTHFDDFIDTAAISDRYVAECEDLIRQLTGCDATCQAGPIHCRFDGVDDPLARYDGAPAHYVHSDYSPTSADMAKAWLPDSLTGYPRLAVFNVWRVLTPPPQSQPLAVCDARSLRAGDAEESKVIMGYDDGEVEFFTQLFHPRERHRWYYFSDMTPDEVLVFKSYDTDAARASFVPHCAFLDPNQPAGAVRMSIEARIWAAFLD